MSWPRRRSTVTVRSRLSAILINADERTSHEHLAAIEVLRKQIDDIQARRTRLLRSLETDDPDNDQEFIRDIRARASELSADRTAKPAQLQKLEQAQPTPPSPELLDLLPTGNIKLETVPDDILRQLFEAFRLQISYDHQTNTATCQVTIVPEIIPAQRKAAQHLLHNPERQETTTNTDDHAAICVVPPTGEQEQGKQL